MKKFLIIIGLILLINFLAIIQTNIANSATSSLNFENPLKVNNIFDLITNIIDFIYTISIPLLAIVVLWAGFTMITSGGKPEKFKQGQNILLYAAIGFGIILLSKGVSLIVSDILNAGNQQNEQQISECTVGEQICSSRSDCSAGFGIFYCKNQGGIGIWEKGECCSNGCNSDETGCEMGSII
jgi:hypothetical protein